MSAMEEEEESQIATTMEQTLLSPMTARALVLMAAAIYGTNFAAVKVLDESMPILVSATLRFGLAATVVSSMTGASPINEATQGGMQVGVWYGLGYLSQAYALSAVDASKVRVSHCVVRALRRLIFNRVPFSVPWPSWWSPFWMPS